VCPLDPALRLTRIGADDLDVQGMQRPPELGHSVAADSTGLVDAKDAMFVAVERDRLAPGFKVRSGCMEIGKEPAPGLNRGRLALNKLEVHQPAGRIVDEDKQCALRAAVLEPPMLAAVDLHEFANALAAMARLVDALSPLLAIEP
jgi:hypothetical protein